jgi:hypothetical protein
MKISIIKKFHNIKEANGSKKDMSMGETNTQSKISIMEKKGMIDTMTMEMSMKANSTMKWKNITLKENNTMTMEVKTIETKEWKVEGMCRVKDLKKKAKDSIRNHKNNRNKISKRMNTPNQSNTINLNTKLTKSNNLHKRLHHNIQRILKLFNRKHLQRLTIQSLLNQTLMIKTS